MLIVSQIGGAFVYLYMLVVWAEIFTTAIGNLFAIHTIIRKTTGYRHVFRQLQQLPPALLFA